MKTTETAPDVLDLFEHLVIVAAREEVFTSVELEPTPADGELVRHKKTP